jgi:hypothetical protein
MVVGQEKALGRAIEKDRSSRWDSGFLSSLNGSSLLF